MGVISGTLRSANAALTPVTILSGGNMKLTAKEKEFIGCLRVARVATVAADGAMHNVPVCPLYANNKIYFGTERNARKVRNVHDNREVAIVFDEYTEAWDGIRGI